MITDHAFVPAPFYPDRCDGHAQDAPGRSVICGAPGKDHKSCDGAEGHVSEVRTETNTTGRPYARCKECLLYLGPINFDESGALEVAKIRAEEVRTAAAMTCEPYRVAVDKIRKLLRQMPGGLVAKIEAILKELP